MKLHTISASPRTWQVNAVAAQLGLTLEQHHIPGGSLRSPEYLALNPTARAPTLVDGDLVLWETEAITQYLCSKVPNTLYPEDARVRADVNRWISWQIAHWNKQACEPLIFERVVKVMFNMGPVDAAAVERATASFHREAPVLDAHLASRPFMVGSQLTLADFAVVMPLLLTGPAQLPVGDYPNIRAWLARMMALPSVRGAVPAEAAAAAA